MWQFYRRARKDKPQRQPVPTSAGDRSSRISVNASAAAGDRGRAKGGRNHRVGGEVLVVGAMDAGHDDDITLDRRRRTTCAGEASAWCADLAQLVRPDE